MSATDGISEAFDEHLRAAVMIGTQVAQRHVQRRADRERERAAQEREAAQQANDAQLQALRAEQSQERAARDAAIADLRKVNSETWWEHADVDEIRRTWTSASEYRDVDPRAADAAWKMTDYFSEHGITDPDQLGSQPELALRTPLSDDELLAYRDSLERQDERYQERADAGEDVTAQRAELAELRGVVDEELADEPRRRAGSSRTDQAETVAVAAAYDSHERREQLSQRLRGLGLDADAARAVEVADRASAHPIADAVAAGQSSTTAPRARRTPTRKNTLRRSQG